jgi:hypothetical protein
MLVLEVQDEGDGGIGYEELCLRWWMAFRNKRLIPVSLLDSMKTE